MVVSECALEQRRDLINFLISDSPTNLYELGRITSHREQRTDFSLWEEYPRVFDLFNQGLTEVTRVDFGGRNGINPNTRLLVEFLVENEVIDESSMNGDMIVPTARYMSVSSAMMRLLYSDEAEEFLGLSAPASTFCNNFDGIRGRLKELERKLADDDQAVKLVARVNKFLELKHDIWGGRLSIGSPYIFDEVFSKLLKLDNSSVRLVHTEVGENTSRYVSAPEYIEGEIDFSVAEKIIRDLMAVQEGVLVYSAAHFKIGKVELQLRIHDLDKCAISKLFLTGSITMRKSGWKEAGLTIDQVNMISNRAKDVAENLLTNDPGSPVALMRNLQLNLSLAE